MAAVLAAALQRMGLPAEAIELTADDQEAARAALAWGKPGDLLLLLTHSGRGGVLDLLQGLVARGWKPGQLLDGG